MPQYQPAKSFRAMPSHNSPYIPSRGESRSSQCDRNGESVVTQQFFKEKNIVEILTAEVQSVRAAPKGVAPTGRNTWNR
jgi:hypothetical protein